MEHNGRMQGGTRRKTSITLSERALAAIDRLAGKGGNRSAVIEEAVLAFWTAHQKAKRDARDLRILDENAERLNGEAEDVLSYQVDV